MTPCELHMWVNYNFSVGRRDRVHNHRNLVVDARLSFIYSVSLSISEDFATPHGYEKCVQILFTNLAQLNFLQGGQLKNYFEAIACLCLKVIRETILNCVFPITYSCMGKKHFIRKLS